MGKKTGSRTTYKDVRNQNRNHETLPDETTLRDEIFELKRQLMVLKRTNEQYLVKLRKYEDEAKRKDKQVEQLMDPRKNAEVTKVLSTKGAAILMNLKDQNNALIQMILNKDLHIRRLVAEIKMSKLYATTKKNESYKAEINRLRNLLIKSQETLKKNIDVQQRQQETSVYGNSFLEFSSSSEQSSPRDLDELRVTILSLESHIQQSNDLLSKKNQEISSLTNEVNFLRKCFRHKKFENKTFDSDAGERYKLSAANFINKWESSTTISNQNALDFLKNGQDKNLSRSEPEASSKWFSSIDSIPNCSFKLSENVQTNAYRTNENIKSPVVIEENQGIEKNVLSQNLTTYKDLKEGKIHSNSRRKIFTKEKWMRALIKCGELQKLKQQMFTTERQNETICKKLEIINVTDVLNREAELKMTKKIIQRQEDLFEEFHNQESFDKEINRSVISEAQNNVNNEDVSDNETPEMCQNFESCLVLNKTYFDTESIWDAEKKQTESEVLNKEQEHLKALGSMSDTEKTETNIIKSLEDIYHQSLDSSFDSERSYSVKPEILQMEVEVQINSVSLENGNDESQTSSSENNIIVEYGRDKGGNHVPVLDFNDDDDVIVREK